MTLLSFLRWEVATQAPFSFYLNISYSPIAKLLEKPRLKDDGKFRNLIFTVEVVSAETEAYVEGPKEVKLFS